MEYNISQSIKCKICGINIPCIFDTEHEVTVPKVASNDKKKTFSLLEDNKDNKKITAATTALIYLSCPNFHGPFAYEIAIINTL